MARRAATKPPARPDRTQPAPLVIRPPGGPAVAPLPGRGWPTRRMGMRPGRTPVTRPAMRHGALHRLTRWPGRVLDSVAGRATGGTSHARQMLGSYLTMSRSTPMPRCCPGSRLVQMSRASGCVRTAGISARPRRRCPAAPLAGTAGLSGRCWKRVRQLRGGVPRAVRRPAQEAVRS